MRHKRYFDVALLAERSRFVVLLAASVALLTACGGGRGHGTSVLPADRGLAGAANVAFRITIPPRSSSSSTRSPRYVSASTQSITVMVNGGPRQIVNLTASSPNCNGGSPSLSCTVTVAAPVGADTFEFTTYDQTNAAGNVLSHSSATQTIVAGVANTVNVTLGGSVASIMFAGRKWTESVTEGASAAPIAYSILALDAGGNLIIGPFDQPIMLNVIDPNNANAFTLSGMSFNQNGDTITATYNGAPDPGGVTLQFLVGGTTPLASATIATFPAGFTGGANYPASLNGLLGWYDGQDIASMHIRFNSNVATISKVLDKSAKHADLPAIAPNPTYDPVGGAGKRGSIRFAAGSCLGPVMTFPINHDYSIVVLDKPADDTYMLVAGGLNETSALQGHALFFNNYLPNDNLVMYQSRADVVTGAPYGAGTRLIEADYQNNLQAVLYSDLGSPSASNPAYVAGNGITLDNTIAAGNTVTATINGTPITYTETAGDTSITTAQKLAAAINATVGAIVKATPSTYDTGGPNSVTNGVALLTPASLTAMTSLAVSGTGTNVTITGNVTVDTTFFLNCFAAEDYTAGSNVMEEVMLFDHALSAAERKNLQTYFNRKWGLGYGVGF